MDPLSNEILDSTQTALELAQSELAAAEIALIEASAKAETARESAARLESAVAALSGEPPPAAGKYESEVLRSRGDSELSPEEFNKQRKQRQRARQKELDAQNPLAHVKCSGCGRKGKMQDTIIQAPSGASVRMMVCGSCGNQTMS